MLEDAYQLIIGSEAGTEHWCREHKKPQHLVRDPYSWEIDNEEIMMWFCEDCEQNRYDDI